VLAPDVDWAALVERTPAALSSPASPGPWPIGSGGWVAFPGPPFGYGLEVVAPTDPRSARGRLLVRSTASAVRGVTFVLEASVARAARPYLPAALMLTGGTLGVEAAAMGSPGSPLVTLRGDDRTPALATVDRPRLDAALAAVEAGGVLLEGDANPAARSFEIGRFARRSGLDERAPAVLASAHGARGAPVALRVRGGVAPRLTGVGVVLVTGDLEVDGRVDFSGALLVEGRLRLGGPSCRLSGMVWARDVSLSGPCLLESDRGAVGEADRALRLPRLPVLTALARG